MAGTEDGEGNGKRDMTSDRWQQVERLYHAALAREGDQAAAFLKEACAGDDALRHEVESLLAQAHGAAFLEAPALEVAAQQLAPVRGHDIIGRQIGSYQILSLLGEGGMGEVYRAHDTTLKRDVALKILPEAFAHDPGRMARFRREAEVLASLNHPNIAQIYGVEDRALVMELVEGNSPRGPTRFEDAWKIALQIADALGYAHEKGVVHRDLKPENVKVTPDGVVKLLDFGLARALTDEREASPAPDIGATEVGVILGTAAYMAPEQAKGEKVDKRADIWSWGVVWYELLTGERLFKGVDVADTLAQVLTKEPDLERVLPQVRKLLRRCLEKDPKQRLRDIGDARSLLEEVEAGPTIVLPVPRSAPARRERLVWIASLAVAAVLIVALAIPAARHLREAPPAEMRVEINTPSTTAPLQFALSPGGRYIVFVASGDGPRRLWVRALDNTQAQPLAGTEGAEFPFWSPDSRSVGFFADGKLKRIDIGGGPVRILADAPLGRGGAWNRSNVILFAPTGGGLLRVSATGGETPAAVTTPDPPRHLNHRFPQFLPDGQHFLFNTEGGTKRGVYLGSLDSREVRLLFDADANTVYVPGGYVLFTRQGILIAQRLDLSTFQLTGQPITVAENIISDSTIFIGAFSSSTGILAYRAGTASSARQLVWFDRSGKSVGMVGNTDPNNPANPSLAPDGQHVALDRQVSRNTDVWLLETIRGVATRFTFDTGQDRGPVWSPDGTRIVFGSSRTGSIDLYERPASGATPEQLLLASSNPSLPIDWSPDGRFILYRDIDPNSGYDLWVLPLSGDRKPFPVAKTPFEERDGQFSPDGRWVAYRSNESGRFEVYVLPFPGPGGKVQVSTNGGTQPRWRHDGKELFYIAPDSKLMAAPIAVSPDGKTIKAGAPVPLFSTRIAGGPTPGSNNQQYAVASDGRFLINVTTEDATASPITLILNWKLKP